MAAWVSCDFCLSASVFPHGTCGRLYCHGTTSFLYIPLIFRYSGAPASWHRCTIRVERNNPARAGPGWSVSGARSTTTGRWSTTPRDPARGACGRHGSRLHDDTVSETAGFEQHCECRLDCTLASDSDSWLWRVAGMAWGGGSQLLYFFFFFSTVPPVIRAYRPRTTLAVCPM